MVPEGSDPKQNSHDAGEGEEIATALTINGSKRRRHRRKLALNFGKSKQELMLKISSKRKGK